MCIKVLANTRKGANTSDIILYTRAATDNLVIQISVSVSSIRICFPHAADIILQPHAVKYIGKRNGLTPENADVLIFSSKNL